MYPSVDSQNIKMRLDTWLWAARFYKTRQLAIKAIQLGRVLIDDSKVKPSRIITSGICLNIRREQVSQRITIKELSLKRVSAKLAAQLYSEDPSSISRNNDIQEKLKFSYLSISYDDKPNKKARKERIKIKRLAD